LIVLIGIFKSLARVTAAEMLAWLKDPIKFFEVKLQNLSNSITLPGATLMASG